MNKWCIIGVYFGEFPNYIDLWLKSAQKNAFVDFIIFTDAKVTWAPDNVRLIYFTIEKMKELASRKLGFEVSLERPYKCCDLKPAYGFIFEEYLSDYEYWGHCDFDLIWGDLRSFFDKYRLELYDKFLSLGHLGMYKNTYENNRRFMLEGATFSYEKVFTSTRNFAFDETPGIYRIFEKNGFSMFDRRIFADISKIYRRFRLARNDKNYDYQVFCWSNGHIYRYYYDESIKRDEYIYIHFKERGFMPIEGNCMQCNSFYITDHGFCPCDPASINIADMQMQNFFESQKAEKRELREYIWKERKRRLIAKINRLLCREGKMR